MFKHNGKLASQNGLGKNNITKNGCFATTQTIHWLDDDTKIQPKVEATCNHWQQQIHSGATVSHKKCKFLEQRASSLASSS